MKTMYVFLADGFEEIEALAPVDVMRRAGLAVTMVSVTGDLVVKGAHGIPVVADVTFDAVDYADAALFFLPGGLPGATNLEAHEGLGKLLVAKAAQGDVVISAICAAPLVLGHRGLLRGKRAVCYPGFEAELYGAEVLETGVVTDGNITTARGMGVALQFAEELVSLFAGKEIADRISASIMKESN